MRQLHNTAILRPLDRKGDTIMAPPLSAGISGIETCRLGSSPHGGAKVNMMDGHIGCRARSFVETLLLHVIDERGMRNFAQAHRGWQSSLFPLFPDDAPDRV